MKKRRRDYPFVQWKPVKMAPGAEVVKPVPLVLTDFGKRIMK